MMKYSWSILLIGSLLGICCASVYADTLEMKDGRLLEGQYMGGTQQTLRFQTEGKIVVLRVDEILALTFASLPSLKAPSPPPDTPEPAGPAAAEIVPLPSHTSPTTSPGGKVVLPAGTSLSIRMLETVDVEQNTQGDTFEAMLDADVKLGDQIVVPKGAQVRGQVISAIKGRTVSTLALTLEELILDGASVPLVTTNHIVRVKTQDTSSRKITTKPRPLQVPYQALVDFEITQPVTLH